MLDLNSSFGQKHDTKRMIMLLLNFWMCIYLLTSLPYHVKMGLNVFSIQGSNCKIHLWTGTTGVLLEPYWSTTSRSTSPTRVWSAGWRSCTTTLTPTSWSCWWETRATWNRRGPCPTKRQKTSQVQLQQVLPPCAHFYRTLNAWWFKKTTTNVAFLLSRKKWTFVSGDVCFGVN